MLLETSYSSIINSTIVGVSDGGSVVVVVGVEGDCAQTVALGRRKVLGEAERESL